MGDEICFALPSLQEFEIWRSRVERHLVVDFVHGAPTFFHVLICCR